MSAYDAFSLGQTTRSIAFVQRGGGVRLPMAIAVASESLNYSRKPTVSP